MSTDVYMIFGQVIISSTIAYCTIRLLKHMDIIHLITQERFTTILDELEDIKRQVKKYKGEEE